MGGQMKSGITVCNQVKSRMPTIKHSTKSKCTRCNKDVWVSPGTRISIEKQLYPEIIVCVHCALKELNE